MKLLVYSPSLEGRGELEEGISTASINKILEESDFVAFTARLLQMRPSTLSNRNDENNCLPD